MNFSFSTLGCPRWTLKEIIAAAKDLGYAGVELRGLGDDIFLPDAAMFRNGGAAAAALFSAKGLQVPCVSTECELHRNDANLEDKIRAYVDFAATLGCPNIRVLGDTAPEKGVGVDVSLVKANLKAFAPYAAAKNVTLLLESNGVFSESALLAETLAEVNSPAVAALWDINHPVRYAGETPSETAAAIGKWVRHVHVKDTAVADGVIVYRMLGKGTLPIDEAFRQLKRLNYTGFISLEWTKRWHPELEEPGVVFSHFITHAKRKWAAVASEA